MVADLPECGRCAPPPASPSPWCSLPRSRPRPTGSRTSQARQYYDEGDVAGAIGELEFAVQALRGRIGEALLATFPDPPDGWTVENADEQGAGAIPFVAAGSMLGRTYRSPDSAVSIKAQLLSGGGFLQGLAGMLMNPTVLAAQPNAKRIRIGRETAVATYEPGERAAQLVLDLGGRGTVMLEGKGVDGIEQLIDLVQRWDLKRAKELLGG